MSDLLCNIDKQTLREAAERSQASRDRLAPLDSEDIFDENGEIRDSVQKDMAIMIAFNDQTNPATVLALLDELEAAERRNAELEDLLEAEVRLWTQRYDCANSRSEAAEKRVAELSANNDSAVNALLKARRRTVTLPTGYSVRPGHPINETERSVMIPKDGGAWLSRFDVEHALRAAGISIKGE